MKAAELTKKLEKTAEELKKVQAQLSTSVQKAGKPLQAKDQTIQDLKDELERMDKRLEESKLKITRMATTQVQNAKEVEELRSQLRTVHTTT